MFDSFKKWIQTTVDTTTNSVLSFNPVTLIDENITNNTNANYNGKLNQNDFKRSPQQQHQQQQPHNLKLSNVLLSSNESIERNNVDLYNLNKTQNQQLKFNQKTPLSPIGLTNNSQIPTYASKTQPTTPNIDSLTSFFPNSIPKSASIQNDEPDVSHLSKEEQAHIAKVLQRAKIEEFESKQDV